MTIDISRDDSSRESKKQSASSRTSMSLIANVKQRDPKSWDHLVDLYSPMIHYWCRRSGIADQDLPDIFQDVFQSISGNIEKFKPRNDGTFRGWLRTITRNRINDHFRMCERTPVPIGGTEAKHRFEQIAQSNQTQSDRSKNQVELPRFDPIELRLENRLLKKALEKIRSSFEPQTWRAFWMVVVEGMETRVVAQELQLSSVSVRVAKSRVLKRLRELLGDM